MENMFYLFTLEHCFTFWLTYTCTKNIAKFENLKKKTFFSSPELKVQVSLSDRQLSVYLPVNFYILYFFSRTIWPILTRLGTNHHWGEVIQVCSNEGEHPSPREDNSKRVKMYWIFFKNLLLQNQLAKFSQT
jgi:hypothetical protein